MAANLRAPGGDKQGQKTIARARARLMQGFCREALNTTFQRDLFTCTTLKTTSKVLD